MRSQIAFCLCDQLFNFFFVVCLYFFCIFQLFLLFSMILSLCVADKFLFSLRSRSVFSDRSLCQSRLHVMHRFFLDFFHIFIDRLQKLCFFFRRNNNAVFCHFQFSSCYRYLALSLNNSSWFVSLVFTIPARRPLDITPIRLVIPRISGISEETTMIVFPCFAILIISS